MAAPAGRDRPCDVELIVVGLLGLPAAQAQAVAAVVGVGRHPVGAPGSAARAALAGAVAATLLRRLARAAGWATRLRVAVEATTTEAGSARVALTFPAPSAEVGAAAGAAVRRLLAHTDGPVDDGALRRDLRAEGAALAALVAAAAAGAAGAPAAPGAPAGEEPTG